MKTKKTALYLDDLRTPLEHPMFDWIIVRSYEEFKDAIVTLYKGTGMLPELISFDHDLGEKAMSLFTNNPTSPIEYDKLDEKTGLHCAKWLIELCKKNVLSLKGIKIVCHSANPIGAKNIINVINDYKSKTYGPEFADAFIHKFPHIIERTKD